MSESNGSSSLSIESPDFTANVSSEGSAISSSLEGTADLRIKPAFDEFLAKLHETARTAQATEVVMDFRKLKFMNSSCVKGLVVWICAVQALPPASQYRIVLLSSPQLHWQRRSLGALHSLAKGLVTIKA